MHEVHATSDRGVREVFWFLVVVVVDAEFVHFVGSASVSADQCLAVGYCLLTCMSAYACTGVTKTTWKDASCATCRPRLGYQGSWRTHAVPRGWGDYPDLQAVFASPVL